MQKESDKIIWFGKYFPKLLKKPFTDGVKESRKLARKAKDEDDNEGTGIGLFAEGLLNRFNNRFSRAISLYREAMNYFIKSESEEWITALEHGIGHCYQEQGKIAKAEKYYLSATEFYRKNKIPKREAMVCVYLGMIYLNQAEYKRSLSFFNRAYRIISKIKDIYGEAVVLNNIASVYNSNEEYDKAIKFYNESTKIFIKLKDYEKVVGNYTNIGSAHLELKQADSALQYLIKAETYADSKTPFYIYANVKINLGRVYTFQKKFDLAEKYLNESYSMCREISNENLQVKVLMQLGNLFIAKKDIHKARSYYFKALKILRRHKYRKDALNLYRILCQISEDEKNYSEALQHHRDMHKVYAEIYNENAFKEITGLKAEIEKQRAENEAEILRLKNLELKREIEIKTKELNQAANYIVRKNDFMDSVINEVKGYVDKSEEGINKNKFFSHLEKLERKKHLNEDLVHFEQNLNKINLTFLGKFSKKFPKLTRIELKICSLIKINLGTKEIAKLLSVSHRTIENHRYRIIQKLQLPKGKSLSAFIHSV